MDKVIVGKPLRWQGDSRVGTEPKKRTYIRNQHKTSSGKMAQVTPHQRAPANTLLSNPGGLYDTIDGEIAAQIE